MIAVERNALRQLKYSLIRYMNSDQFNPKGNISEKELSTLFNRTHLSLRK